MPRNGRDFVQNFKSFLIKMSKNSIVSENGCWKSENEHKVIVIKIHSVSTKKKSLKTLRLTMKMFFVHSCGFSVLLMCLFLIYADDDTENSSESFFCVVIKDCAH
jgi:hypothetical protein